MSEGPYRVGQEVEVTYGARVAEVYAGGDGVPVLRLEPLDHSHASPPGGWVNPQIVNVKVVQETLPTAPGMYWAADGPASQAHMGNDHTDGKRFFYRNASSQWVDVGFGAPHPHDCPLIPLTEGPF